MDLKKYIYGHCVQPVRTKIWDAYSSQYVYRFLPCGKCLHCKNTHINEWCTRLIAQKKYSKYCYYVSLDYKPFDINSSVGHKLAMETAACYHNINKNGTYGMHPLVLCKNHLQDFFKRLRKNTKIKLQYFSCGEYGMHANGHGFGRPHFHNIIFSNDPIFPKDFEDAWSINGYSIGRVDYKDISAFGLGESESIKIFKYVCKYLQKSDFDFEKLATIDFHRAYFKSLKMVIKQSTDLFGPQIFTFGEDSKSLAESWKQYIKLYAPFVVCSRRPSIGSRYFDENLERFKDQDFRLFGLPKECTAFPRYYVRRTKEALINFRCIGEISQKPSSCSRLGYITKILSILYDSRLSLDTWCETSSKPWRVYKSQDGCLRIKVDGLCHSIKCNELNFYDHINKFFYQFDGYSYNVWCKLKDSYALLDTMDVFDVLSEISPSWDNYYHSYLKPHHDRQVLQEQELFDTINALYNETSEKSSYELFLKDVYDRYQIELASCYKTKLLMQNSKTDL